MYHIITLLYGGVGIIVRDTFKTTQEAIRNDHWTFECSRTKVVASSIPSHLLTVYHRLTPRKILRTSEFEEFNTFMDDQIPASEWETNHLWGPKFSARPTPPPPPPPNPNTIRFYKKN